MKKRNLKLLILGLGSTAVFASVFALSLSSCGTSSAGNPYAPYTALSLNNSQIKDFRFQTSNRSGQYYNTNPKLFGSTNDNKYLDLSTIRESYINASRKNTDQFLSDSMNWEAIKNLYWSNNLTQSAQNVTKQSYYDKLQRAKQPSPAFFFGVSPTQDMIEMANIYNSLNIVTNIFTYSQAYLNNIISYVTNINSQKIIDNSFVSISDFWDQIQSNDLAKQVVFGNLFTVGSGNNTYHLWPSGFSVEIKTNSVILPSNANVSTEQTFNSNYVDQMVVGDINSPFDVGNYQDNKIVLPSYSLEATNIKVNYSWFKANKSGGSYANLDDVNSALTSENKAMLAKMGISSNQLSNLSYQIPLPDLKFNVNPEYASYEDPFYSGFFDTVYTGLYSISQPLINKPNTKVNFQNTYPTSMQAKIGSNQTSASQQSINWRGLVKVNGDLLNNIVNYIDNVTKQQLESTSGLSSLLELPYYQTNISFDTQKEASAFTLSSNTLTAQQIVQMMSLFTNPLDKTTGTNATIFNNINNLEKLNALNLYAIGLMQSNPSVIKIKDNIQYKSLYEALSFGNDKVKTSDVISRNEYNGLFTAGQKLLNDLIPLAKTTAGTNYTFNNNGTVSSPATATINNLELVAKFKI